MLLQKLLSQANSDGVIIIDSWVSGPTIGIVAITHGNEKVWLEVFDALLHSYKLKDTLRMWRIFLILWNIDACLQEKRYLDRDMNRMWNEDGTWVEFNRKIILEKYIYECDHLLDLHSTSSPSVPMAIDSHSWCVTNPIMDYLDVEYVIHGIMPFMSGETLVAYHKRIHPKSVSIVIECWSHEENWTEKRAIKNTLIFLAFFRSISDLPLEKTKSHRLNVIECVHATEIGTVEYFYSTSPKSFDLLEPNTLVATCGKRDIYSPSATTLILMPTPSAFYVNEEIMYFAESI